jgi:trigger factor
MNISRVNIDALNATLTAIVEKPDYESKVEATLRDYRRKAQMPGFRPGMVPMGVIKKMYQKTITAEEVFNQVSTGIAKYIEENRLNILGSPLPSKDTPPLDFDTQSEFEFLYDVALAPKVQLKISKDLKIPRYTIAITDDDVQKRIDRYRIYYGKMATAEKIEKDSLVRVDLAQRQETGHTVKGALLSIKLIPAADQQALLLGLSVGETVEVNIRKMLTNDTDCAAFLNITKEQLETIDPVFTLTIKDISHTALAEIDQTLFDNIYGKDVVTSEEAFVERVKSEIHNKIVEECEYRFALDVRHTLMSNATVELPEAFLKRWLLATSEKKTTEEEVEKAFPSFAEKLRWELIEDFIRKKGNLVLQEQDLLPVAQKVIAQRFATLGMNNISEERLEDFAYTLLSRPEDRKLIVESAAEHLVVEYIRNVVTIEQKEVTHEELNSLLATPQPTLLNLE